MKRLPLAASVALFVLLLTTTALAKPNGCIGCEMTLERIVAPQTRVLPVRSARHRVRPVQERPVVSDTGAPDFWRRLANCESPDGRSGHFIGYFQFSPDTARAVGISGNESYEEQRAAAQRWASQVSPGTTAGWPHCWWVALR